MPLIVPVAKLKPSPAGSAPLEPTTGRGKPVRVVAYVLSSPTTNVVVAAPSSEGASLTVSVKD